MCLLWQFCVRCHERGFQRSKTENRRQNIPEHSDPEFPGVGHFSGTSQDRAFILTFSSGCVSSSLPCRLVAKAVRLSCARAETVSASSPISYNKSRFLSVVTLKSKMLYASACLRDVVPPESGSQYKLLLCSNGANLRLRFQHTKKQ